MDLATIQQWLQTTDTNEPWLIDKIARARASVAQQ